MATRGVVHESLGELETLFKKEVEDPEHDGVVDLEEGKLLALFGDDGLEGSFELHHVHLLQPVHDVVHQDSTHLQEVVELEGCFNSNGLKAMMDIRIASHIQTIIMGLEGLLVLKGFKRSQGLRLLEAGCFKPI